MGHSKCISLSLGKLWDTRYQTGVTWWDTRNVSLCRRVSGGTHDIIWELRGGTHEMYLSVVG